MPSLLEQLRKIAADGKRGTPIAELLNNARLRPIDDRMQGKLAF